MLLAWLRACVSLLVLLQLAWLHHACSLAGAWICRQTLSSGGSIGCGSVNCGVSWPGFCVKLAVAVAAFASLGVHVAKFTADLCAFTIFGARCWSVACGFTLCFARRYRVCDAGHCWPPRRTSSNNQHGNDQMRLWQNMHDPLGWRLCLLLLGLLWG